MPRSRHLTAAAPLLALLLALAWAGLAAAERSPYTLDTDPLRLGLKSLEAGRLQEARARFEEAVAHNHQVPRALFGLGRIADLEGRYDEAEAAYRRALEAGGDPAAIRARLGLVLLRDGRDREAAAEFDAALAAEPKLWEAHYGRARLLLAQQMWDAAQKELERGKGRQGVAEGEDLYHHGLALLQSGRGDLPAAELSALRALHLNPGDPQYGALVGEIYERRGSPALAIDAFEQALNSPGMIPTAPMLRSLGGLYRKVERYDEARDSYLRAAAIDSTYTPALRDLADLLRAAKRYDQAARTYLRCAMLDPDDVGAHLGVALCCLELRNFGQAAASAAAARALDPQREDAKFLYARAALHGDDAARAAAAALMAEMPTPPAGYAWAVDDYTALADWLAGQKRFDEAAAALASAAALDPADPNVPFQTGVVALRRGDAKAAADHFRAAIALNPDAPAFHLNLGIALYQSSLFDEAIPSFRRALELNPDLTVGRLLLAQTLASRDDVAGAEAEYRRVLLAEPQNAKAQRGLGFCLLRRADYAGAAEAYRAATTLDPDNADGWAGLGSAELGRERLDAAEAAFGRARRLDPDNAMLKKGAAILDQARNQASGR
ncbi:MAG: tetratricopeptide repeat protein [bacterium]|nr:tetratricopeptide repeat protein [bacterium]